MTGKKQTPQFVIDKVKKLREEKKSVEEISEILNMRLVTIESIILELKEK